MSEPAVIASYVVGYGAILAYAVWLHLRHRRSRPGE
jgi:hypothetical protein